MSEHFWGFKITPYSWKLINAIRCYKWNTAGNSYCFFIFCCLFSPISWKHFCCKVYPFNVLHQIITWYTTLLQNLGQNHFTLEKQNKTQTTTTSSIDWIWFHFSLDELCIILCALTNALEVLTLPISLVTDLLTQSMGNSIKINMINKNLQLWFCISCF